MNEHEQQVEQLEVSLEEAKKTVALQQSLSRLTSNPDFKAVFLDRYFKDEPVRLVMLKADPEMQEDKHQENINKQIDAIGAAWAYLRNINIMGNMAARAIAADEETLAEMVAEGEA